MCQKQAGHVMNEYVVSKLMQIGFEKSYVDEQVFFWEGVIFIIYVEDGILMVNYNYLINKAIERLVATSLKIDGQG